MILPSEVYSASQVRQLESAAVTAGTPGYTLMQRAGAAAFALLRQRWPQARKVAVVAGPGNNGGDGLVLARAAHQGGLEVTVMLLGDTGALRGEAAQAFADLQSVSVPVQALDAALLGAADIVVDALLGSGVRAPLREDWHEAIVAINQCARPVLALDLPSGLDPDTGKSLPAVRATVTLTFIALKQGLFLGEGPEHVGELHCADLQLTPPADTPSAVFHRLTDATLAAALPPRGRQSHKGQFGRMLVVGGGTGMPGAVRLAAEAALRMGAGRVTVASLPEHLLPIIGARPELMFKAVRNATDALAVLQEMDVILVGPGLGRDTWAREVFAAVVAGRLPTQQLVVDADALNLMAEGVGLQHCLDWVLTPHPGEAARLLHTSAQQVQTDRPAALRALCAQRGGTIVLKGAMTLIGTGTTVPRLCDRGNPGMSVPGMGDVLAGAIAGLLAQNGKPFDAAAAAVYAHAVAGDRCARQGVRGMLALEVATALRAVLAALP